MDAASRGRAAGPAAGTNEQARERCIWALQRSQLGEQVAACGVGEPGPDIPDVDQVAGSVVAPRSSDPSTRSLPVLAAQATRTTSAVYRIGVLIHARDRRPG
jgi:hypothetical protein